MKLKAAVVCLVGLIATGVAGTATAAPILGGQLYYTGGEVTVTTLPVSSGYASELGLYSPAFNRLVFLTNDEPADVVKTFKPSDYGVSVGSELIFGIRVVSDLDREYFMGAASRNADGVFHATVDGPVDVAPYGLGYIVGFEDIYGGGDFDYDDNRFFFTGSVQSEPVPAPAVLSLLVLGSGAVLARRRRRA